jgi:hypothetical protein
MSVDSKIEPPAIQTGHAPRRCGERRVKPPGMAARVCFHAPLAALIACVLTNVMAHEQEAPQPLRAKLTAPKTILPFTLTVAKVTPQFLPDYLDPFTHPSPSGQWSDFPISTVMIDGELWIIYKNGYSGKVIRYKGTQIENAVRQPDGTLNPSHPTHGTVVHPYLLGGMWFDPAEKKLCAPMHCEYPAPTSGDGIVLRQTHLATSTDKGLTWKYEGPLLTGDTTIPPFANSGSHWDGGDGDFYLYVDEPGGYFYIFTTFYMWPKTGVNAPYFMRHRAARCKISDKMASGKWQRFYNGGWTEPGIKGKSSYVEAHRVIYSSYLKKYIGFNYGSGLTFCDDLARQDWSPCLKIPGSCWGTQKNLEITPWDPEAASPWVCGRTLFIYTYLQGWNAGPANKYRLEFGPGETTDAAGYLGWGTGANAKKFWDPDWEGAATTDPLRPYGEPACDLSDPIESRRVRKVGYASPEMRYSDAWTKQDAPVPSMCAGSAGDSLSFAFRGTGIYWRALQGPDCGMADVFLDGQFQKTVDCHGSLTPHKFWFVKTGLDAAVLHTLKIVVRGEKHENSDGTLIKHISFEHAAESSQADDAFSSVMGKNGWRYLAWDGDARCNLEFDAAKNVWQKTGGALIGPDYMTPGAVRQWTAPRDGFIRVEGCVAVKAREAAGFKDQMLNDLQASVLKGAATIWTARQSECSHDLTVEVRAGDTISFTAQKPGQAAEAGNPGLNEPFVFWNPMLTYVEKQKQD